MRGCSGFSLVEMLVAITITVIITGLASALALDAQATWRADSARVDLQQRARVAVDKLTRALHESGIGPHTGPAKGPLVRVLAPVIPRRMGIRGSDPPTTFRTDAFTVLHAVTEAEHATLLFSAPAGSPTLEIDASPCGLSACGFLPGTTVMVHDAAGSYDVFTVTAVQGLSLGVRHHGTGSAVTYPAGSPVIAVESTSYYFDPTARLLRVYDGDASDLPLLDDVVQMNVEYAGDVLPPLLPRPAAGQENCLYDAGGIYRTSIMPVLAATVSPTILGGRVLTDGPWCGSGGNQFDADLLRVRRVRVTLRFQAADPAVRGTNTSQFHEPGTARRSSAMAPDVTVVVDVTPRNLRAGG